MTWHPYGLHAGPWGTGPGGCPRGADPTLSSPQLCQLWLQGFCTQVCHSEKHWMFSFQFMFIYLASNHCSQCKNRNRIKINNNDSLAKDFYWIRSSLHSCSTLTLCVFLQLQGRPPAEEEDQRDIIGSLRAKHQKALRAASKTLLAVGEGEVSPHICLSIRQPSTQSRQVLIISLFSCFHHKCWWFSCLQG